MLTQTELAKLVEFEDDREVYIEPSYIYKKKNYKWFKVNSKYWYCDCFNINLSFGKVTIMKPYKNWQVNSCGKRLDTKCIYLVYKNWKQSKWFSVPYKNYVDEDRAFDSSMKSLIRLAKVNLTKTSR